MVYLVTVAAVYDHGTGGVFSTREAAEAHAFALGLQGDGHHVFRINEVEVDVPITEGLPLTLSYGRRKGPGPVGIEFIPWPGAGQPLE